MVRHRLHLEVKAWVEFLAVCVVGKVSWHCPSEEAIEDLR